LNFVQVLILRKRIVDKAHFPCHRTLKTPPFS